MNFFYHIPSVVPPYPRLTSSGKIINLPARGKAAGKKFTLSIEREGERDRARHQLWVQKELTNQAVLAWINFWIPIGLNFSVVSSDGYLYDRNGDKLGSGKVHYVYFILHRPSNAVNIGYAQNVEKRLKVLQQGSPIPLELLKTHIQPGLHEAEAHKTWLYQNFKEFRMEGDWFWVAPNLSKYIGPEYFLPFP